jgi:hypothetical protein
VTSLWPSQPEAKCLCAIVSMILMYFCKASGLRNWGSNFLIFLASSLELVWLEVGKILLTESGHQAVTSCTAEDCRRLPKKRGFENFGRKLCHAVEDELFRVAFPSGGQELEALADHGVPGFPRRKVWAGEI